MLTKYLIIALAVLALAAGGLGYGWYHQIGRTAATEAERDTAVEALQTAQEALKRSRALSARLAKEKAATALAGARTRQSVEKSLEQHQDWASTPVPKGVQDAME